MNTHTKTMLVMTIVALMLASIGFINVAMRKKTQGISYNATKTNCIICGELSNQLT